MEALGWTLGDDLYHYVDQGGCHSESYWGARLALPLRARSALKWLTLTHNRITDAGVAALLDNLGAKELKRLEELDVFFNQVGDAGCAAERSSASRVGCDTTLVVGVVTSARFTYPWDARVPRRSLLDVGLSN